jgi:hypothetical protein
MLVVPCETSKKKYINFKINIEMDTSRSFGCFGMTFLRYGPTMLMIFVLDISNSEMIFGFSLTSTLKGGSRTYMGWKGPSVALVHLKSYNA